MTDNPGNNPLMATGTTDFRTDVPLPGVLEQMAKKYLSLEEAASLLDMTTEQLMKVREQGDIRGFADRDQTAVRLGQAARSGSHRRQPQGLDAALAGNHGLTARGASCPGRP